MQRVKLLENVSARKHTDGQADFVLEWSKSNTMHQTMQQYIAVRVCLKPCVSELHQHPAGSGCSRKDPGREETWVWSDSRRSQTHLAQCARFQTFPLSAMWRGFFFFPKSNLKVAVPHVGDTPGTNVFAAFCQLEERGKKSLMCENEVSIRRGRSRYEDDEDRRQQQRRAGADNA